MATIIIHWKDRDIPNMEIKNATYKGGDNSIIKISSGDKEYWFNWQECWFLESIPLQSNAIGVKLKGV